MNARPLRNSRAWALIVPGALALGLQALPARAGDAGPAAAKTVTPGVTAPAATPRPALEDRLAIRTAMHPENTSPRLPEGNVEFCSGPGHQ